MLTFVLLVVLGGGIAAYAVTESESSQRATKPDDLHGRDDDESDEHTDDDRRTVSHDQFGAHGDGDDEPDDDTRRDDEIGAVQGRRTPAADEHGDADSRGRATDDQRQRAPVVDDSAIDATDGPPLDAPVPPPASDRSVDSPRPEALVAANRSTRGPASGVRERPRRTGAHTTGRRTSIASLEQRRLRDDRARQLEAVVVAGPVPGDVGDVVPARTAIEGRYADVAHTAWWRRLLSLVAIVGVVFGLVLVGTLVIFVAFAIGADFISNAI